MDAPAVAHRAAAERERPGERRAGGRGERLVVEGDRGVDGGEVAAKLVDGAKPGDAWI